jgi:HEAT repeat protein
VFGLPPLRRTLEAAIRDLGERNVRVRASAVRDLANHADRARDKVVSALERALRDEAAQVRSAAAVALADVGGREVLSALLYAIEDVDPNVRQMALAAVGEIGDERARERVRRALSDERPEIRFQAVIAFGRVAPGEADQAVLVAMSDPDPLIRYIAIRVAEEVAEKGEARLSSGVRERLARLIGDGDAVVRVGAAVALGRSGDSAGESVLFDVAVGTAKTREPEDEAAAVELCGDLGLRDAIPALERRAFGFGRFFRETFAWQAKVALARLGHEGARADIARDLGSRSRDKRTMAVVAAGRAKMSDLRGFLQAMVGDDAMVDQEALALALGSIDPRLDAPAGGA